MMARISPGFETFRKSLLAFAQKLHRDWGLSPREDLEPERLVQRAIEHAHRIYPGKGAGGAGSELDGWVDGAGKEFLLKYKQYRKSPIEAAWCHYVLEAQVREDWSVVAKEYYRMMLGYGRVRWSAWGLPHTLELETIVQGAWETALKRRSKFRGTSEGEFVVWLRWHLEGHAQDERDRLLGTQKRDPSRERSLNAEVLDSSMRMDNFLAAVGQSTPSSPVRREEWRAKAFAEIESLPAVQRDAIIMTMEGLSEAAIAERLGITLYAVRQNKADAFGSLRRSLRQFEGGF